MDLDSKDDFKFAVECLKCGFKGWLELTREEGQTEWLELFTCPECSQEITVLVQISPCKFGVFRLNFIYGSHDEIKALVQSTQAQQEHLN